MTPAAPDRMNQKPLHHPDVDASIRSPPPPPPPPSTPSTARSNFTDKLLLRFPGPGFLAVASLRPTTTAPVYQSVSGSAQIESNSSVRGDSADGSKLHCSLNSGRVAEAQPRRFTVPPAAEDVCIFKRGCRLRLLGSESEDRPTIDQPVASTFPISTPVDSFDTPPCARFVCRR